jgi:hypothetical protein
MTVDTRRYTRALVDENFKKGVNYKLLASCIHAELGSINRFLRPYLR